MKAPQLSHLAFEARARRTDVASPVMESYEGVREVRLVSECGSRVNWKTLLHYVDGKLKVPIRLDTDKAYVPDPIEAIILRCMRLYIAEVVPKTDEEALGSLGDVYGAIPAPNYSTNGAGASSEATEGRCNCLELLDLSEWGRIFTWLDHSLVRKSWSPDFSRACPG